MQLVISTRKSQEISGVSNESVKFFIYRYFPSCYQIQMDVRDLLLGNPSNRNGMDLVSTRVDDDTAISRAKRFVVSQSLVEQGRLSALYIIFIIAILAMNSFVVAVIIASKAMRASSRHVLIISVCLGDLLMGVFVLPVSKSVDWVQVEKGKIDR